MDEIDLVIFDLAGTTVVDGGQVPQAFTQALAGAGVAVGEDELRAVRGASKREAIRTLLAQKTGESGSGLQARADQVYTAFRQHLMESFDQQGVQAVPGAAQTFDHLQERGVQIALNTGFDRTITDLILDSLGWRQGRVQAVVCGDDVPQGRPAPYLIFRCMERVGVLDVRRVANVGDTVLDMRAGWNAGVRWNIGVLSGAGLQEQLSKVPHTHLISSVAELTCVIKVNTKRFPEIKPPP